MTALRRLLRRPPENIDDWFTCIAAKLMAHYRLVAGHDSLRLTHLEFYYHSADHPDPFVHGDPRQHLAACWYFHRVGAGYRGGSFKGLDLTFGSRDAPGGILLRAAVTCGGQRIVGPSKLVDYLLDATGFRTVRDFDAAIAGRRADDPTNPLRLAWQRRPEPVSLERRPRVGLSLKRATPTSRHAEFIARLYGFHA